MAPGDAGAVCEACACGLPGASALARQVAALPPGDTGRLDLLRFGPRSLVETRRWDELEAVLTDLPFLEAKAAAGLAFDLLDDFALALRHLHAGRPAGRILALLDEALRRDLHFIVRYPATLFQCLWNSGWWYDSPQAEAYYDPPEGGWPAEGPPWERRPRLAPLLESWRRAREERTPGPPWLCSLRPPNLLLGSAQLALMPVETDQWRFLTLAFAPDGRRLFAWLCPAGGRGGEGRLLRAWDAESGRDVGDFEERDVPPCDPAVSPDGRWRAQCGGPGGGWGLPVRLLDAVGEVEVASLATDPDVNIQSVAFAANGERLIGGGWGDEGGGEVMVWDVASRRRLAWLRPSDAVFAVALSRDGRRAVSGTSVGVVQLWDVEAGTPAATLEGHESAVQALACSPDGRRLASAAYDGTVRVWDLHRVAPLPRLRGHPDQIVDVIFSTDGYRLITVSVNCTTWIWDGEDGKPVSCPYRSDGVILVGGPPRNGVYADRRQIVSLARGAVWDAATGDVLRQDEKASHRFVSRDIVWAPGGRLFATSGRLHGPPEVHRPESPGQPVRLEGYEGDVGCLAFSPDGRWLVSGSQDQTVRVWDAATGAPVAVLRGHEGPVTCVAFAPEGNRIVSGATDRTVRI
jgi:WD40 repeat protein